MIISETGNIWLAVLEQYFIVRCQRALWLTFSLDLSFPRLLWIRHPCGIWSSFIYCLKDFWTSKSLETTLLPFYLNPRLFSWETFGQWWLLLQMSFSTEHCFKFEYFLIEHNTQYCKIEKFQNLKKKSKGEKGDLKKPAVIKPSCARFFLFIFAAKFDTCLILFPSLNSVPNLSP